VFFFFFSPRSILPRSWKSEACLIWLFDARRAAAFVGYSGGVAHFGSTCRAAAVEIFGGLGEKIEGVLAAFATPTNCRKAGLVRIALRANRQFRTRNIHRWRGGFVGRSTRDAVESSNLGRTRASYSTEPPPGTR